MAEGGAKKGVDSYEHLELLERLSTNDLRQHACSTGLQSCWFGGHVTRQQAPLAGNCQCY